ncbi:hypothetical protein CUJ84_pRLN3000288 (plasmid) [Rhizobium leguminosarum]|uniref:Uncharacterized protein n=1 Tax=Rhizobium leguminosarum TaxID=384 RepID=A0A2K9ZGM4_RHILE|nr:hypothetical protein CUJ84_pRLN3000288 [Rhizobium leguminosarum]
MHSARPGHTEEGKQVNGSGSDKIVWFCPTMSAINIVTESYHAVLQAFSVWYRNCKDWWTGKRRNRPDIEPTENAPAPTG